jgi:D-alanyl-lipoteichoic acid acyltransferase DltB (MBOAT superfamily)
MWLLAASCYFYMYFKPVYILIILFTIIIDYCAGILIEQADEKHKKIYLIMSLAANIGVLAYFKYFNFLADNVNFITTAFKGPRIPLLNFLLPIGLSFHTFQAMSYTIEVYRGNQKAERHFGIYSLYVMFYPQMVAGPIERPQHILPQLHRVNNFNSKTFTTGLLFMMIGLFKKMVIADRLALYVNPVYANPHGHSSFELLIAAFFFGIQIYCDFSGYSDIAVGTALVLGIELMKNFNYPFTSKTIAEYWRRWHISLSTWFNDYLYMPVLIGKRDWGKWAIIFALFITFFMSGLWHGAGWTFIIWGLLHAAAISYEVLTKKFRTKLSKKIPAKLYGALSVIITFCYLIFTWIFFRSSSINEAFYVIERIFTIKAITYSSYTIMTIRELCFCLFVIIALLMGEKYLYRSTELTNNKKITVIVVLFFLSYFFGIFNEAQFIYFQF